MINELKESKKEFKVALNELKTSLKELKQSIKELKPAFVYFLNSPTAYYTFIFVCFLLLYGFFILYK